jgi:hypothetical protein
MGKGRSSDKQILSVFLFDPLIAIPHTRSGYLSAEIKRFCALAFQVTFL